MLQGIKNKFAVCRAPECLKSAGRRPILGREGLPSSRAAPIPLAYPSGSASEQDVHFAAVPRPTG